MKKNVYKIYFNFFDKKMKHTVIASSKEEAIEILKSKIVIDEIKTINNDDFLKDVEKNLNESINEFDKSVNDYFNNMSKNMDSFFKKFDDSLNAFFDKWEENDKSKKK